MAHHEQFHKDKKHAESLEALGKAKKILGIEQPVGLEAPTGCSMKNLPQTCNRAG